MLLQFKAKAFTTACAATLLFACPASAYADEGMWTYNNIPYEKLKERYDFTPSQQWLEHLMKSSVRFNSGGSGSFVSADGLVLTNHHVAADTIAKLSSEKNDYMTRGFYAETRDKELRAKDLELNVLQKIEDVTTDVESAVKPEMSTEDKAEARRAQIEKIEKAASDKSGLRANVVTLYQGGQYHLYYYKRYTDVRLVFAPEKAAAFFGGDDDNFEYPRYCLDMTFFRVYEDGKPARLDHYLKWSAAGPQDQELAFVAGNPGRTSRLHTLAHLTYTKEVMVPYFLNYLLTLEKSLKEYSAQGAEQARRAEKELFSVQNNRKLFTGRKAGLDKGRIIEDKAATEADLRRQVSEHPDLKQYASAWEAVEKSRAVAKEHYLMYSLIEYANGINSDLFSLARHLVRLADEDQKPGGERLPEYQDARRQELLLRLNSEAPIYLDLEQWKLERSLAMLKETLGADHPVAQKILAGKSAADRARELIEGTRLADPKVRAEIMKGGSSAIDRSTDTMILLAKSIDPEARALLKTFESQVDEPEKQAYRQISNAIFKLYGTDQYPDATFTPRLSFGQVKGYKEGEKQIPPATQLGGIFESEREHNAQVPWKLPQRWHQVKSSGSTDWDKSFNFVSTNDIIGGNSGSPVVNRQGHLVGLIFDSNIHGLVWDYQYDDTLGRAVSVASDGMLEAIRSIYKHDDLVKELAPVGQ